MAHKRLMPGCSHDHCAFGSWSKLELQYHEHIEHDEDGLTTSFIPPEGIIASKGDASLWAKIRYRNNEIRRLSKYGPLDALTDNRGNPIQVIVDAVGRVYIDIEGSYKPVCSALLAGGKHRHAVCTRTAGYKTDHLGVGRCYRHDRSQDKEPGSSNVLPVVQGDPAHSLSRTLASADKLTDKELLSTRRNLVVLQGLLEHVLSETAIVYRLERDYQQGETLLISDILSDDDIHTALRVVGEIRKTHETYAKILNMLVLDPRSIRIFVDSVMRVVTRFVRRDDIPELLKTLREEARLPMGDLQAKLDNMGIEVTEEDERNTRITGGALDDVIDVEPPPPAENAELYAQQERDDDTE